MNSCNHLSQTELDHLKQLPPLYIPKFLYNAWQKLSRSEEKVMTLLYEIYQYNNFFQEKIVPVLISRAKIAEKINRGKTTVNNVLAKLRELGWIITTDTFDKNGFRSVCRYYIALPKNVKQELLNIQPRKKTNSQRFKEPSYDGKCSSSSDMQTNEELDGNTGNSKNSSVNNKELLDGNSKNSGGSNKELLDDNSKNSGGSNEELLDKYNKYLEQAKAAGFKRIKACSKALQNFSRSEQEIVNQLLIAPKLDEEVRKENFSCPDAQKTKQQHIRKLSTYNITNNNYVNTVNKETGQNSKFHKPVFYKPEPPLFTVDDEKIKKLRSKAKEEISKLKAEKQIPENLLHNGKRAEDLVDELIFHCCNYNPKKIKSPLHAYRAGLRMICQGTWDTPKKLKCQRWQESIALEKRLQKEKEEYMITEEQMANFAEQAAINLS